MIGEPLPRTEDLRLLRGLGQYVDDIDLPGVVHLAAVRSPYPHARITSISTEIAQKMPGVVGVYSAADIEPVNRPWPVHLAHKGLRAQVERILPVDKVRYVGEPVAFVVAESRYLAEDACAAVEVEYEPLPGMGTARRALELGEAIHEGNPDNIAAHVVQRTGDLDKALQTAPHTLTETYEVRRGGGHSMEGRATAARYDPSLGTYTVWDATQTPHAARRLYSLIYGIPEEQFRVIAPPDVGGGFGPKAQRYPEEMALPWLARQLGRPVKFIEDRYEHFLTCTMEHPQQHVIDVAFDEDGVILGLRDIFTSDMGAYGSSLIVPTIAGCTVPGPYRIPNLHIEFTAVFTNKVPQSAVRGAGRPQGVYVMERTIDRIADYLGLDPAEVRFRNLIQPDQFPYAVGLTFRDGSPLTYDSGNYPELLKKGLDLIDYPAQRRSQAEKRAAGVYRGIGISVGLEGVGLGPFEGATVRLENSGRATVILGAPPQGQGFQTTYAQICAEYLGVDFDQIDVVTGDTSTIPYGIGTFASRVMANAGPALATAATEVRTKLLESAASMLEAAPEDLEIGNGQIRVRGMQSGVSIAEVAQASNVGRPGISMAKDMVPGLVASSYFNPERAGYSSSVQVCVVDVDAGTGEVEIVDWAVGHDCGRIVNPLLVEGQVLGGIAHGLSNAFYEEALYEEDGTPLTVSYLDYPIPSAREMPWIKLYHIETSSPLNPLGVKGAGEAGTLGVPAVIAAAVEDALRPLGVRVKDCPLSPAAIGDLIREAQEEGTAGAATPAS